MVGKTLQPKAAFRLKMHKKRLATMQVPQGPRGSLQQANEL